MKMTQKIMQFLLKIFLNRACSDFYQNKFLPGSSFVYDPFFVHLSGMDANCKTFRDWVKLIPENRKLLMANFFENDDALFSKFLQEATSNFNSKIDDAIIFGTGETVPNNNSQEKLLPNTNTSVTLTLGTSRTKGDSTPHTSPGKSSKRALELTPVRRQVVFQFAKD